MSQVQRQDVGRVDHNLVEQLSPRTLNSRTSNPPVSPLGTSLIPRDFLGQRSDAQSQRAVSSPISRKLSPSPLQASHVPSPTRPTDKPTIMAAMPEAAAHPTSSAPIDKPENLERVLSSPDEHEHEHEAMENSQNNQDTPPSSANPSENGVVDKPAEVSTQTITVGPKLGDSQQSPRHHGQLVASPPDSPASTTSSVMEKPAPPPVLRTSSIDSAISSLASTSGQPRKPSTDAASYAPGNIANLIAAAGSAENLILHLLKEKQNAASQNAQLWKLVEKQRTMVLGLNKDLERAMKDKERYRKKLKELENQPPPLPRTIYRTPSQASAKAEKHPEKALEKAPEKLQEKREEKSDEKPLEKREEKPIVKPQEGSQERPVVRKPVEKIQERPIVQKALETSEEKPLKKQPEVQSNQDITESILDLASSSLIVPSGQDAPIRSPMDTSLMPTPLHLGQSHPASAPAPVPNPAASTAKVAQTSYLERHPPPPGPPPPPPTAQKAKAEPTQQLGNHGLARMPPPHPPPTESLPATPSDISPVDSSSSRSQERPFTFTKKAPPAPLNLQSSKMNIPPVRSPGFVNLSDSETDDEIDIQEVPFAERGRRKTREDDDRDRELLAKKAEEARLRAKQQRGPDARSHPPALPAPTNPPPAIPRPMPQDSTTHNVGSINAMLSPETTPPQRIKETLLSAAPLSPGLPVSPRPFDRPANAAPPRPPRESQIPPAIASPPMSPRLGSLQGNVPLSPRAPKGPIPLPPNTPLSLPTPPTPGQHPQSPVRLEGPRSPRTARTDIPMIIGDLEGDSFQSSKSTRPPQKSREIFKGYVHEDYPNLLLPPNALPSIDVKVASSRLRPSRHSYMALKPHEEDPVFTLSIFARSNRAELWRVEKVILSLPQLDQHIKSVSSFSGKLPDRKLFSGHSPAVIDARRNAVNAYFEELLDTQMDEKAALVVCRFLTDDAIEPRDDESNLLAPSKQPTAPVSKGPGGRSNKEGYLTKRGKNFGGWKTRYFLLQGPELKYYESPGGVHLGTIKLPSAQIGKQSSGNSPSRSEEDADNQYRHAFLVLEPKRKDSSSLVRHVLCAESDIERDEWVEALLQYVDYHSEEEDSKTAHKRTDSGKAHITGLEAKIKQYGNTKTVSKAPPSEEKDTLRAVSYEHTVAGQPPQRGETPVDRPNDDTPSPTGMNNAFEQMAHHGYNGSQPTASHEMPNMVGSRGISGPVNGAPIQDVGMWGNKPPPQPTQKELKKRSIWGFKQKPSADPLMQIQGNNDSDSSLHSSIPPSHDRSHPVRPVFGIPLVEAVEFCGPVGVDVALPAVVYRCIQYLKAKDAASEEGIFRLSGSNVVIRSLKERFNVEGDVDFLADDQYYDVHAVASLFKSYMRELPNTILTAHLHLDFQHVLELETRPQKIAAFHELVGRLPAVNYTLLKALSEYLQEIVNNAHKNKMTVRNVGIVFSPTLNIPAPVLQMFVTEFDAIFGGKQSSDGSQQSNTEERAPSRSRQHESPRPPPMTTAVPSRQHESPRLMPASISTPRETKHDTHYFPNPYAMQNQQTQQRARSYYDPQGIPAYEQRHYVSDLQPSEPAHQRRLAPGGPDYASQNHRLMSPANAATAKAKRRESSLLFLGGGTNIRKSSMPQLREDQTLVTGKAAYN